MSLKPPDSPGVQKTLASKLEPYRDLIQKKLEIERVSIRGVYEFLIDQNSEEVIGTYRPYDYEFKDEDELIQIIENVIQLKTLLSCL